MQQLLEFRARLCVKGGLLRPFERVANCCVLYPIPKPPRRTSRLLMSCPSKDPGLQANPSCGPKFFFEVAVRSPPLLMVKPVRAAAPAPGTGLLIKPCNSLKGE